MAISNEGHVFGEKVRAAQEAGLAIGAGAGLGSLAERNMQRYLVPGNTPTFANPRDFQGSVGMTSLVDGVTGTSAVISDIAGGGAVVDVVNGVGGARRLTTGTSATGFARLALPDFSALVPTISNTDGTKKFYRMHRARMITTPTADTILRLGSFNWSAGVHGTGSLTKYTCRLAATTVYLVSTISIDTNWHVFEHWYDGASAWFSVDGEDPVGLPAFGLWPLNAGQSFGEMSINKVGNAVDHQADVSFGFWGGTLP